MIKKLRQKFIILSMLSVFVILVITMGAINISNYVVVENNASGVLSEVMRQGTGESGPGGPGGREQVELRQEHYFVVSFNQNGSIKDVNNRQMFMLSEAECKELASKVYNNELVGGKYGNYRYQKETKQDGLTYVGFVDIKERLDSFNNFRAI